MKIKPIFFFILIIVLSVLPLHATTVKWLVKPGEYDNISYYCKDIFKCKKGKKIQLVDITGKKLLPSEADSITDFHDGYALVLDYRKESLGKKTDSFLSMTIKGFLSEKNHRFVKIDGDFRTTFYSYFSEGMLVVSNSKGKLGYFDTQGNLRIKCQYYQARPFIKGWASVVPEKKKTPKYIDKNENPLTVYFNNGILKDASSFNENGEALVVSDKDEMAIIGTNGRKIEKTIDPQASLIRKHDRAYADDVMEYTPLQNEMPTFSEDITPFSSDGLSGYYDTKKKDMALMPQFTYAGPIADNCAIVILGDKYGIITLMDGSFSSSIDNMEIVFKGDEAPNLNYILHIPESFDAEQLEMDFDNGGGQLHQVEPNELQQTSMGEYTFKFTPNVKETDKFCTLRLKVGMEGLILWQDTKKLNVQNVPAPSLSPASPNVEVSFMKTDNKANSMDLLTVKSKVSNNTDEPISVRVVFSIPALHDGNKMESEREFEESIGGQKSKQFPITFKVVKQEEITIKVTVTTTEKDGKQDSVTKTKKVKLVPNDA